MAESNLPLFRFSLRQLLASFVIVSVLLATIAAATMVDAAFILLISLVAAAHVFATVLGNRLQAQTNAEHPRASELPVASPITSPPAQPSPVP